MTRSDQREAPDQVLREVARELADGAPPAPEWSDMRTRFAERETPQGSRRASGPLLLVAATLAVVVAGVAAIRVRDTGESTQEPLDVAPAPSTEPTSPEPTLSSLDPVEAQLCLTRRNARAVIESGLIGVGTDTELPGYTPNRARVAALAPLATTWAGLMTHPSVEIGEAATLTDLVDSYRTIQALSYAGPDGNEGDGLAEALSTYEADVAAYASAKPDPAICQPVASTAAGPAATLDETRCVAWARLRDSVERLAPTGDAADDAVVEASAAALLRWFDRPPLVVLEVATGVSDLNNKPERNVDALSGAIDAELRATQSCLVVGLIPPLAEGETR